MADHAMPQPVNRTTVFKASRIPVGRDHLLNTLEFLIEPLVLALSLWVVTLTYNGYIAPRYIILSLLVSFIPVRHISNLNTVKALRSN